MTIDEVKAKLVAYVQRHPELSYEEISTRVGIKLSTLTRVLRAAGYRRNSATTINMEELEK